jgi:nucleoside-diphosphate-sugar epimerase
MNILLTGYAGLLGRHIARSLKQSGHRVRVVLHQRTVARMDFAREADELLWGSLEDPRVREQALRGIDAVIHSAWKFSTQSAARPTANEVLTETLFRESLTAGVKEFAFISSVAVYGMQAADGAPITETSPVVAPTGGFVYPAEKVNTEQALRTIPRGTTRLAIFRPGPIFDDEKSPVKKVLRLAGKSFALGFGTGENPMPYIHAADVGDAVGRWIGSGKDGVVFNVTPTTCLRHRDWYVAWGKAHGLTLSPLFVRAWVMRSAAWGGTMVKRMLGKTGAVDVSYALAAASRDLKYSNAVAVRELGWTPAHTDRYHV